MINGVQVSVYFMVKFMDISVSNWAEAVVISKWLLLYYALMQVFFLLLLKHGDVEINPEPRKKETSFFSCLHRNINSILAHNKLTLLQAYNTIHQYDILAYLKHIWTLQFQMMTLLFPSQVSTLLGQIIATMLKGVVFVCITRKSYLWEWLMSPFFIRACYVK